MDRYYTDTVLVETATHSSDYPDSISLHNTHYVNNKKTYVRFCGHTGID